ncbi:nectin-3-like protein isoform X1 [Ictalurus punctatus]|uniref:Nectin cell adhesion molecule 3 n=2 Tax=Ictalurus punctatus TaxID=7998 RepID=A0A2D0T0T2_ICTPU|nr:nectin-3-like protein isoform X1 [Ictalurus punctatus]
MELLLRSFQTSGLREKEKERERSEAGGDMALGETVRYLRNKPEQPGTQFTLLLLLAFACGVCGSQVVVPPKVSGVLGKNVTLSCRVEVDDNLSLTQSSWERRLPSGWVTVAVYNPMFGISIQPEYERRLSFRAPSTSDATIVLEDVGFSDAGDYICKASTFPLGIAQASITLSVLVEPKVYISAGSAALLDGGNRTTVATCIAERARPKADVFWESQLYGMSEMHTQEDGNGTTTTQVHYIWEPTRDAQGDALTCVVRHPALPSEFRMPYNINVQFAPDILLLGYDGDWYVGRENVQLKCQVKANPPAHLFKWIRLDGEMPDGVAVVNNSLTFLRPLQRNDSGVYRCEVGNNIGLRTRDLRIRIQDPPSTTTMPPTTPVLLPNADISVTAPGNKQPALFTSPTLAPLHEGNLGTIVGGAVGGVLFLLLFLVLVGVCYQRRRRTFRGDYYTKQYLGPSDMQKAPPPPSHELHIYNEADRASPDTKLKSCHDVNGTILSDKDREEWGGFERERSPNSRSRALREANAQQNLQNHQNHNQQQSYQPNHHPAPQPNHQPNHPSFLNTPHKHRSSLPPESRRYPGPQVMGNGSPFLPEDCYDSDYVSHTDGSMISRREWYV